MKERKPIEIAVIGGGCGSIAAAFELTRPEHRGKYHVTIYQVGWRLGGKGASGRGPADRVQEHGLHIWMGFYENAFRLLRECYAELNRAPGDSRIADWRDAFFPAPFVSVADRQRDGSWFNWMAYLPPGDGLPGDPLTVHNPFSLTSYMVRAASLVRSLLVSVQKRDAPSGSQSDAGEKGGGDSESLFPSMEAISENVKRLLKYGLLTTVAGLIEAAGLLEFAFRKLSGNPDSFILRLLEGVAASARYQLERSVEVDDEMRRLWEVIDLVVSGLLGILRFGLITDPRGFDAIDEYDCREWLRMNGASERSLKSAMMRGVYDLVFAYEDGDFNRPRLAAGQAMRRTLRMFLTYRGAFFWKMRAGMGDVVFAPFYEVLKRRGVTFRFFHRLENVKIADPEALVPGERPYVQELELDVQAEIKNNGEYNPLIDSRGLPCWPSRPDYSQIVDGERLEGEGWDFESHWDRRRVTTKTLRVSEDFDFVVLGVGLGEIPHVCREIVARDKRWSEMVTRVKTVSTQAFQLWLREDMEQLGWRDPPVNIASFGQPFDTWADMRQLIPEENWPNQPRAVAYFCSLLPDSEHPVDRDDTLYPARRREEVRRNAVDFLNRDIGFLWPGAVDPKGFRWELLMDPKELEPRTNGNRPDESRFNSQFWTANVNPTDRYVLSVPGSIKYRISPLDNTYDNLTIAGDWTDCGFNEGCVEAAVKSGRLAAHAISQMPALEEIIGYDHP